MSTHDILGTLLIINSAALASALLGLFLHFRWSKKQ